MSLIKNKIKINFSLAPSFLTLFISVLSLFIALSPLAVLVAYGETVTTLDGGTSATTDSGCSWTSGSGKGKYCLLAPISAMEGVSSDGKLDIAGGGIDKYLVGLYKFGIYIAIGLAVLMIVIGGMQYVSTDAVTGKSDGRGRIVNALQGLILALMAYLILNIINPAIPKSSSFTLQGNVNLTDSLGNSPGSIGNNSSGNGSNNSSSNNTGGSSGGLTNVTNSSNNNGSNLPTVEGYDYESTMLASDLQYLNNYNSQKQDLLNKYNNTTDPVEKMVIQSLGQDLDTTYSITQSRINSNGYTTTRNSDGSYSVTKSNTNTSASTNSGSSNSTAGPNPLLPSTTDTRIDPSTLVK